MSTPVVLSWSSGKDSAFMLQTLAADPDWDVVAMVTALHDGEVTMHGTPDALVRDQARAAGVALHTVELPWPCRNEVYAARHRELFARLAADGIGHIAYGDLHLEDVRAWREQLLADSGLAPVFPLWARPTPALAREIIASGIGAQVVCVDTDRLPAAFVGRSYNDAFIDDLPDGVDPCGEGGEFHTFVWRSPCFDRPLEIHVRGYHDDGRFRRAILEAG